LLLVGIIRIVVKVVGQMDVKDVLLPVRLPGAKLDDEFWRIIVATTIKLTTSATNRKSFSQQEPMHQDRRRRTMIPRVPQPGASTP
jgi:hypothetical protein